MNIHSATKNLFRLMAFVVAAFPLLLSSAPGANAAEHSQTVLTATDGCPDGWVSSSAPGGCSPGYLTLKLAGIRATDGCPDGWVRSSAPGGCSPGSFTLKQRRVYQAQYHCAFGVDCDLMVEAVIALGGTCTSDGPDTDCVLPPLID